MIAGITGRTWRTPAAAPTIRDWNGEFAVYNPLSGHTHILDLVAGEVLLLLQQRPQSDAELRKRVAALLEMPSDEALATRVDHILEHLDEIGLIEPADAC